MTAIDLAEKFFAAVAQGDVEGAKACCADSFRGSQNGGPAMDRDSLLQFSAAVKALVPDFRYEETVRTATDTGFVEEHRVRGTLPDGSELDLMVCVVGEVKDDRITVLREYVDTAGAAGLLKALGAR
ncbi:nuclear transport factor 2 family protein [Altererythrobacter lutimaris]|uniref:Nuclear transport factor 2 family protein n=1 Tax=Altererythrobacter lutimaris TaxID=2743979 RepID=A0A850HBI0_9SPHN|nr:nuclear transport factor 2 family protein [Altererythrobacter lutimaris]NVE94276.1 nuclear transport factor 2 family protein [Altererythrobacter lutimaris]